MSKHSVLVIATTFPRWNGDSEPRFILDFAKSLLPYADVTVLVPSSPGALDKEVMEGVKVERFHYFPVHENTYSSGCHGIKNKGRQKTRSPLTFLL